MPSGAQPPDRRPWGLLSRHGQVLLLIAQRPAITVRRIADSLGFSERAITGALADLEQAGMLHHERIGRGSRYQVQPSSARLPWAPQRTAAHVVQLLATAAPGTPPAQPPGAPAGTAGDGDDNAATPAPRS